MKVVLDSNIIFSALLNPKSRIFDLIYNSDSIFNFFAPSFLKIELDKRYNKLLNFTLLTPEELGKAEKVLFKKIKLLEHKSINSISWAKAYYLAKDIDEKDTPFIALAIDLQTILWTGDKKLKYGLKKKGFDDILFTNDMIKLRKNLKK